MCNLYSIVSNQQAILQLSRAFRDTTGNPKAMPAILTTPAEIETWMTAERSDAKALQRPLPDGSLIVVARGARRDPAAEPPVGSLL